jgi:hypothetical protein
MIGAGRTVPMTPTIPTGRLFQIHLRTAREGEVSVAYCGWAMLMFGILTGDAVYFEIKILLLAIGASLLHKAYRK